jgi:hypothetical protein
MASLDDAWEALFDRLAALRTSWPARAWTYDRRLKCVTCALTKAEEAEDMAAVAAVLPASWTASTLGNAPPEVQEAAGACGGLRAGQSISWGGVVPPGGADETSAPAAFGLWWPWGDAVTISLRIGLHAVDQPEVRYLRLRDAFGIA